MKVAVVSSAPEATGPAAGALSSAAPAAAISPVKLLAMGAAAVCMGVIALAVSLALTRGGSSPPPTRTYHIAVEEVPWRYAPSGYDNCSGLPAAEAAHAGTFILQNATLGLIGDTYWRRRYVSYEPDGTFSKLRTGDWWTHAGIQGPTLRAGVGEVLRAPLQASRCARPHSSPPNHSGNDS